MGGHHEGIRIHHVFRRICIIGIVVKSTVEEHGGHISDCALGLKDDTGEFNRQATLKKLENGLEKPVLPAFDQKKIEKQIERLKTKENK